MKWKSITLSIFLILVSHSLQAKPISVLIIKSQNTPLYNSASKGITEHINKNFVIMSQSLETQVPLDKNILSKTDIIIAIGSRASNYIATQNLTKPIFSILIPKSSHSSSKSKYHQVEYAGAIFIDQPITRKSKQIKALLPNTKRLGIISSLPKEQLSHKINILKKDFLINYETVNDEKNLLNAFRKISLQSDAILADPDNAIYNKNTIKRILISSYHSNTPLIGYSEALTRAGALISVFSPPYYIGKETAEILNQRTINQLLQNPVEKHPKYYKVTINERVARSMKIPLSQQNFTGKILTDNE